MKRQVRVIAVNRCEGRSFTRTFKGEPDAWSAFRETQRPEIIFSIIGRVERHASGLETFTAWETFPRHVLEQCQ